MWPQHKSFGKFTLSSMSLDQNRANDLWYGSDGKMGFCFQTSSMYSRITRDSDIGFSLWTKTGTFLWTGLYLRRRSLLLAKSSWTYLYSIPFHLRAICTLQANGLPRAPKSFTSSWFVDIDCNTSIFSPTFVLMCEFS